MIKVVTAHPRITVVAVIGVTTLVATSLAGFSPADLALNTGNSVSHAWKFLKAAGIISAITAVVFVLFRFNIVGLKMAPENSAFMVARRGKIARDKSGDVVLYESGRNRWHVINYRHLAPVHFGDRFVSLGVHEFVVDGITWKQGFELRYRIPKDKKLIERTVTSVSDQNWWDGQFNQLANAVQEKAIGQLGTLFMDATLNRYGLPDFDSRHAEDLFGKALSPYGVKFYELIATPVSRTDAQQQKDGNVAIADAISRVGDFFGV